MNQPADRSRPRRRVPRLNDLERRVERLESELRWLRRAVETRGEATESVVGPCPDCQQGILRHRGGELRCDACGYARFL
ncbi:hypothetical protein NGM10_17020 (plasmid) [Halorussus salilacus]|uniref:hypothetical protein n=1 Tax=Halorussus salilacus TaxID=2953750 RepID=UPI0020A142B5|nr:hypothetical protein [Halorussus salilacus]USZ69798.1 hypothetical protein NGM10_17020 [Halorussus salilacus]